MINMHMSIKTSLRKMTFDSFLVSPDTGNYEAYMAAKEFAESWPKTGSGLMFVGEPGRGKTHLAAAIANHIGEGYFWASTAEFLDALRPKSDTDAELRREAKKCYGSCFGVCGVVRKISEPGLVCKHCPAIAREEIPLFEQAKSTALLILDDLGTAKPSDWVGEQLYRLVNYRLEEELPVVATTNYSLSELEERLGHGRIVSRLVGLCDVYRLEGEDWRLKR